tara:strand:- start:6812 stop:7249 length:438 start_codon:yes stop_codon:yes gene_type:complete
MASVNLDTTTRLDITCRQGDTFELTLTLKDASGNGLDLSTDKYQFLMQVRSSKTRPTINQLRVPNESDPSIVIGSIELGKKAEVNFSFKNIDDDGNVTIFLSADDMRKIDAGRYRYDLQYKVGDVQKTVLEGSFRVNGDVSKALS